MLFSVTGINELSLKLSLLVGARVTLGHHVFDPVQKFFIVAMAENGGGIAKVGSEAVELDIVADDAGIVLHLEIVQFFLYVTIWINCSEVIAEFLKECSSVVSPFWFLFVFC